MNPIASVVIVAYGLFFIGLTVVVYMKPALAGRFFMAFASSARTHYAEQAFRRSGNKGPPTMNPIASVVIVAYGLFFIGLTVVVYMKPALAGRFFMAFASSARTHYAEQAFRLLMGSSLVALAPAMWQAGMFLLIGWMIVISSVGLMLIPWQWHHRFGRLVLPVLLRHMRLYALGLLAFGILLLYGVFAPVFSGGT